MKTRYLHLIGGIIAFALLAAGIYFRFLHIEQNNFFYYDEGYYLGFNRANVEIIGRNLPLGASDLWRSLVSSTIISLGSTKPLWLFLLDLRVFFVGADGWYWPRMLSAVFSLVTMLMTFIFARRYYSSNSIAVLSVVVLATLPSHVFYSRCALQESLSTLMLLSAFYSYFFIQKFWVKVTLAGFFFAGAYYTNYRLITVPAILFFSELFISASEPRAFRWRQWVWTVLIFAIFVFGAGNFGRAENTYTNFSWMFYQAQLAKENFSIINYISYPYYLISLESPIWFGVFFGSFWLFFRKDKRMFPFFVSCLMMVMYSLAMEKGIRYLCVVFPFMAMAGACFVCHLWETCPSLLKRAVIVSIVAVMFCIHLGKDFEIAHANTDYEKSVIDLRSEDPNVKFISTQSTVQELFTNPENVIFCPDKYFLLRQLHKQGFRYLVVGPQAYISLPVTGKRFERQLEGFLQFIIDRAVPVREYPHFSQAMMERFVFEHSQNLTRSLEFLEANKDGKFSKLRVYNLDQCIPYIEQGIQYQKILRGRNE